MTDDIAADDYCQGLVHWILGNSFDSSFLKQTIFGFFSALYKRFK